ncbi:MAG: MFS transporter [Alphaproteobacteria bacterium]
MSRTRYILAMAPGLGLAFILSQFLRSIPAVIAPDLRAELELTAGQLSALPAALFFGSAVMQLPAGVLLDRFGARITVAAFLFITACGVLGFSLATTTTGLTAWLLVTGWGIAPIFMGTIVLLSRWVRRDRLATMTALTVGVGGTGMLLSATPFAAATAAFGWRDTLTSVSAFAIVLIGVILLTVRDRPPDSPAPSGPGESLIQVIRGLSIVFREPKLYAIGCVGGMAVGSFLTFRALWVGPYLNDVFGSDLIARGNIIFAISLAWLISAIVIGPLDRVFDTRRMVVAAGAILMAFWFALLAVADGSSLIFAVGAMVALGLCSGLSSPIFAHARALFPDRYVGRLVTAINLFIWGGVFLVQVATGLFIDLFPTDSLGRTPADAYRWTFAILAALLFTTVLFYLRVDDVPPSKDEVDPRNKN